MPNMATESSSADQVSAIEPLAPLDRIRSIATMVAEPVVPLRTVTASGTADQLGYVTGASVFLSSSG
jgi:hypothetical protein